MTTPFALRTSLSGLVLAALAACGGGDRAAPPAVAAAPSTATVSGRAVDGPLQGATACYDLNDNGDCDTGEPVSAPTDAEGAFRLSVALAEAGRHRVVVQVPASAVDKDTGSAVGSAYTLRAPAAGRSGDHSVFVSPLTTLVQAHMDHTGATLAEAVALVKTQAGLGLSPLDDFTLGGTEAHRHAALVARLTQLTALEQAGALTGVAGTPDRTGALITQAMVDTEIARSLVAALPALAGAAIDPAVAAADAASLQGVLRVQARALAAQLGLDAARLRAGATAATLAEPPFVPGVATATLVALRYTNSNNWLMRTRESSAEDNTPDAQNRVRYADVTQQSAATALGAEGRSYAWTAGGGVGRVSDLHWNGSSWLSCSLTDRASSTVRDAQGRSVYDFCTGWEEGSSVRRVVDLTGRSLLSVARDLIRSFPGGHSGVSYASWGPADLGLYGSAVFPAGAYLIYNTNTTTRSEPYYDPRPTNVVAAFSAAVAAGGDTRSNSGLACNDPQQTADAAMTDVTTLEDLVARNPGRPCLFFQGGATPDFSLDPNAWWGNSTVNLGDLANTNTLPAGTGNYYNTTATLRVGFAASGNRATFYRCYRRASDGSPRNCSTLGLGSWSIQTLGDARVLGFSVQPALAQKLGRARVFVERGGRVYHGGQNPVGNVSTDLRLNMVAANTVLTQLGLPRVRPVTAPGRASGARAAALATLQGVWGTADPSEARVFRFGSNGRFFLAEAKPFLALTQEQAGAELGWFDYDPSTQRMSTLREVDSNLTSGSSHPQDNDPPITITATAITSGSGANAFTTPRLETAASGLVGLWALDSATDLAVPHLAFFSNGRVMFVSHKEDAACLGGSAAGECPPGVEYAEYSFDAGTGAMRAFNALYDTNGCQGLFDTCPAAAAVGGVNTERTLVFTFPAGNQTLSFVDGGGVTRTLHRIAAQ